MSDPLLIGKKKVLREDSPDEEIDPELLRNPVHMPASAVKFTEEAVLACLTKGFKKTRTKVSNDAVKMMEWAIRVYVMEVLCRCAQEAQNDHQTTVDGTHLERILAQFMLDFS